MSTPILLSLNIPFCPVRCAYCDKGNDVIGDFAVLKDYIAALRREVQASARAFDDCQVQALWVGGGIAGHLFDEELGELLRDMRAWFRFSADAEVTLKVHPGMVSTETLAAVRRGGVTRLSVDYATAEGFECEPLGRFLPPGAMDVTKMVLAGAPVQLSFDVLTGLPAQTAGTLERTLQRVADYGARHVSLIPLRVAAGTPFADGWAKENAGSVSLRRRLPDETERDALTEHAGIWLCEHGFEPGLPGEYALPGCACRYLALRHGGCQELAFGAGAKTRIDGMVSENIRSVKDYCRFSPDPERLTLWVRPV